MAKKVTGREKTWHLLETIGRGDAGEVLRVRAELSAEEGVMKRPVQNVSGGTIVRQATQIETEGKVLALLNGLNLVRHGRKIRTPLLIDRSPEGTSSSANMFIISEEVTGTSISELLRRKLQEEAPLSQALVLKVLAAAFQLLQKVHEKGVIWNDVKMDHIFWDAQTNTLSFIDWGNSLYLDPNKPDDKTNPMLDYQQLIEEGRALMEQTAPELLADINWPSGAGDLDELDMRHLQMRMEYMETHFSMRIFEYNLLLRRFIQSLNSLDGLEQTLALMRTLQKLGVEFNPADVLSACQRYLLDLLEKGESKTALEVYHLLEMELSQDLTPNWEIAGYLLGQHHKTKPNTLADLLRAVFESDWTKAAWIYREHFLGEQDAPDSDRTINSLRTMKLDLKPYALISTDLAALEQQSGHWLEAAIQKNLDPDSINTLRLLSNRVEQVRSSWETLQPGEKLGDQFLSLRQVMDHLSALRLHPASDLQTSLLAAMSIIRGIYRAWADCDLNSARKQIRELFLLEPSLSYLPDLEAKMSKMTDWLNALDEGPADNQAVNRFSEELLRSLPPIHERLGEPAWLSSMLQALRGMQTARSLETLREEARVNRWALPWLNLQSLRLEIPESHRQSLELDAAQKACLEEFHHALRASSQPADALKKIRQRLPAFHQVYADLATAFAMLFSQLRNEAPLPELNHFPREDQPQVAEVNEVLRIVLEWKEHTRSVSPVAFAFPAELLRQWDILAETERQDAIWRKQILPRLTEIKQKRWAEFPAETSAGSSNELLAVSQAALAKLQLIWKRIPEQGLYRELIEEMIYQIDSAQSSFFKFWRSLQQSGSVVTRWLSGNYQAIFSEINQQLLQIARGLRSVELAHSIVNQPEMARTRMAQNNAGDLMYTLVKLDDHIMPQSRKPSVFRRWQQQFLELIQQGDRQHIIESIQTVESIHPLLPWFDELVQRDADYFDLPKNHQW